MNALKREKIFPKNPVLSTILGRVGELAVINGSLLSASGGKKIQTILVTSSTPGEGRTTTCISMAYSLSTLTNQRILLVDGHLSKPQMHQQLDMSQGPGLTDYILSSTPVEDVIYPTRFSNFFLMPCGTSISHSMDVFTSPKFTVLIKELTKQYDYIVFDGPPFLTSSDVTVAAPHFDGLILVVQCERTKREVATLVTEKIGNVGGRVLGVVLNRRQYYIPKFLY